MLFIMVPIAFVPGTVRVRVHAVAVSHIINPLSFINIAIGVDKPADALRLVGLEPALVKGAVLPGLSATTFTDHRTGDPLSLVFNIGW